MKKLFLIQVTIILSMLVISSCKKGDVGPQGPQGERGEAGSRGETGSHGAAGADGNLILSGTGEPAGSLGVQGDYYLNTTNATLYGPKTNAGWGKPTSLQGPRGATGAQGPKGDTGATGPRGAAGAQGPKGDRGETGPRGATGAQGPKGDTGATGPRGAAGAQGPKGDRGETGPRGATGAQGPKGDTGATGPRGATGAQGPKGDTGAQGSRGATGAQGPRGEQGEAGSQILSGAASPTTAIGRHGDYYFHTTTGALFGPKSDAGWGAGIVLRGVQGPKGDKGDKGDTGARGAQGERGPKGDKGDPGTANVIYSEWIRADWSIFNARQRSFSMNGVQGLATPTTSSVRVYMRFGVESANYPLPYTQFSNAGNVTASYYFGQQHINVGVVGTGIDIDPFQFNETYFRYVIIPGGAATSAQAQGLDLTNLNAVSEAFDIPLN